MASQSQDSLRLQSKAMRQNSSAAKIYFGTTRMCKFFGDFLRSKMILPPSSITRVGTKCVLHYPLSFDDNKVLKIVNWIW